MTAAIIIFAATAAAIMQLGKRIPEWVSALCGAFCVLLFRVDSPANAWNAIATQWDVLLFFAGLTLATAVAEEAGVFGWGTWRAAVWGKGSSRRLYVAIVAIAAVTTILLTNDAAVLVIAPLAAIMVTRLQLPALPFVLSVAFIANAASAILPISNPTNFILARAAGMNLERYVRAVEMPAVFALCAGCVILWLLFGRSRSERYAVEALHTLRAPRVAFVVVLIATALAMIVASALSLPVGATALAGGLALAALLARSLSALRNALSRSHLTIVVLVASLFVIVDGMRSSGALSVPVRWFSDSGAAASALATALFSNIFNNLPVSIVVTQMLHHDLTRPALAAKLAAGAIIGLAVGPNLTTVGSLSTILMLIVVRERGIAVSAKDFLLPGIAVTAATLAASLAAFLLLSD